MTLKTTKNSIITACVLFLIAAPFSAYIFYKIPLLTLKTIVTDDTSSMTNEVHLQSLTTCTFTLEGREYIVEPCTTEQPSEHVITVGVANDELEKNSNPFFYFYTSDAPSNWSAFWNEGKIGSTHAQAPLPGVWKKEGNCFVAETWRLCFPL